MEILLGIVVAILLGSFGFNVFSVVKTTRLKALLLTAEGKLATWEHDKKEEMKENVREKVSAQKEVKRIKQRMAELEENSGFHDMQAKYRDLTLQLVEAEMEIEKRDRLHAALREGRIAVSKPELMTVRSMLDRLIKKSNNIAFRKASKKLIAAIDTGLEDVVEYRPEV